MVVPEGMVTVLKAGVAEVKERLVRVRERGAVPEGQPSATCGRSIGAGVRRGFSTGFSTFSVSAQEGGGGTGAGAAATGGGI